ncbi:hypothetical protein LTR94_035632, partial [Friedmanniomyces endolithicus]
RLPGRGPRHLSVCDQLQHRGRSGGGGVGRRAQGRRLRSGDRQGLYDPRGRGAVRLRTERRGGRASGDGGSRGGGQHRAGAALRLVRRGAGAPVGGDQRHRRDRPDETG